MNHDIRFKRSRKNWLSHQRRDRYHTVYNGINIFLSQLIYTSLGNTVQMNKATKRGCWYITTAWTLSTVISQYCITQTPDERHGETNYRQLHCLLNDISDWQQTKHKSSALLDLCGKKPPATWWFPSQRASIVMWKVFRCHNVMCCAHILLCFILLWVYQYPVFNLFDTSSYILQGCFIDIGKMKYLFRCQWSNPEDYG